jgi:alanine racemase
MPVTKLSKTEKSKLRTWVELDTQAIRKNFKLFKKMMGEQTILMPVVKSNAYGHGLVPFTQELVKLGVKFLGVDSFEEALELRKAKIRTPILVFGYVAPAYFTLAAKKNISVTISSLESLRVLTTFKSKPKLKVHIKADTGLGRQGFQMQDIETLIKMLHTSPCVTLEGLYSHLAVGETPEGREFTYEQARRLDVWSDGFKKSGFTFLKHLCATSSTMFYPDLHYDMVRVGIGMYGLWPSRETKEAMSDKYTLHPVLSWKSIITEIKSFPKGARVSYDLTEELTRDSRLAIVPVGYWHGYPRALSRKGILLVNGQEAKIIGTVCMDMVIIDVTDARAKVWDEVVVIGGREGHYAEADMLAQDADTINYEITTRINPIIKRFYRINPTIKRFMK